MDAVFFYSLAKNFQTIFAGSKFKIYDFRWQEKVMVCRHTFLPDKKSASARQVFFAVHPNVEVLLGFTTAKTNV